MAVALYRLVEGEECRDPGFVAHQSGEVQATRPAARECLSRRGVAPRPVGRRPLAGVAAESEQHVIERSVLGVGKYAVEFQDDPSTLDGDGNVMIIQTDGKAAPQATNSELRKPRKKQRKLQNRAKRAES